MAKIPEASPQTEGHDNSVPSPKPQVGEHINESGKFVSERNPRLAAYLNVVVTVADVLTLRSLRHRISSGKKVQT